MIRQAHRSDLAALVAIENSAFSGDRLSRRNFDHILKRGHSIFLVDEQDGVVRGYLILLLRRGTSLARLYSIAVAEAFRGVGVAGALVAAAEEAAEQAGCIALRLEVRTDNIASLRLFEGRGYRRFGRHPGYYEDGCDALRLERRLAPPPTTLPLAVPYYRQSLDFTCGPAALMMAMAFHSPALTPDLHLELQLWRESTTIFMTSGHGGCGPYGLALAAHRRGYRVSVAVSEAAEHFVESVRDLRKREVIRLVNEEFRQQMQQQAIPLHVGRYGLELLERQLQAGALPLVLISSYRFFREKVPHWVVVTGIDAAHVYLHDPYVAVERGRSETDTLNLPVPRTDFLHIARYGRTALQAALFVASTEEH